MHDIGCPRYAFYLSDIRDSLQFGAEMASVAAIRDLDKPLVVYVLGPEAGGIYAAALRVVDTASTPVAALQQAAYSRYFRHARLGSAEAHKFGMRILPIGLGLSIVICICLVTLAWVVPIALGASYEGVISTIQWLGIYPVLVMLSGSGSDLLRSIGMLSARVRIVLLTIVTFLPACYFGAAIGGLFGVVVGRSACQIFLATVIWITVAKAYSQR
jgi:O-antigen/teichoic acid export membrane protein